MQVTKLRRYKNNYKNGYGRITLNEKTVNKFIKDPNIDVVDIVVHYDAEKDVLIVKKIEAEENEVSEEINE